MIAFAPPLLSRYQTITGMFLRAWYGGGLPARIALVGALALLVLFLFWRLVPSRCDAVAKRCCAG